MGCRQLSVSFQCAQQHAEAKGLAPTAARRWPKRAWQAHSGVTLLELIIAMAILSILMSGILPLSYMTYKRTHEIELRRNLRIIRNALDDYKHKADEGLIPKANDESGYPLNLDVLVDGVESTDAKPVLYKFLRRIPRDPMTEDGEWGLRSYTDEPGSDIWGGQDVYDIYSLSDKQALDGTNYRDW
jgi:general secretion pathway protein G